MLLNTEEQKGNGRTCFWRWRRRLQRWCGYFRSTTFHSSPAMPTVPPFLISQFLRCRGFCFFLWLCSVSSGFEMKVSRQWWCWLSIIFGSVLFFFFLQGRRQWQGWSVTLLCLSLLLCVFFYIYALFLLCFFPLFLLWFLGLFFSPFPFFVNCWVFIVTNPPLPQPNVSPPDKHGWGRRFLLGLGREA